MDLMPLMSILVAILAGVIVYITYKSSHESKKKEKLVKKLPMEFSKKILVAGFGAAIVIVSYAMWIQYLIITQHYVGDTNIIITLLTIVGTEITAASGFYYWKSKKENEIKLQSKVNHGHIITEEDIHNEHEEYNDYDNHHY